MTAILDTVEILKGAAELAKLAGDRTHRQQGNRDIRKLRVLIDALRSIYFSPRGVLALLKIIAEGGYPTEEQVELVLTDFNDAEPFVFLARERLDLDFHLNADGLTLKAERVLREIS